MKITGTWKVPEGVYRIKARGAVSQLDIGENQPGALFVHRAPRLHRVCARCPSPGGRDSRRGLSRSMAIKGSSSMIMICVAISAASFAPRIIDEARARR